MSPMRRQATDALEIEQIQRISALLGHTISAGEMVVVTTADRKQRAGKRVSHQSGSRLTKRGKVTSHYGSIELATATRMIKINYLDVAWIAVTRQPTTRSAHS